MLLLEAGEADRSLWFRVPVGHRHTIGNPRFDWCWKTEAETGLAGRRLALPRGKVLGGSTAINGMVAIRGHQADHDALRDAGMTGWGWDDVLPCFKRHEMFFGGLSAVHAATGEWRVDQARVHWPINDSISQADNRPASRIAVTSIAVMRTGLARSMLTRVKAVAGAPPMRF